MSSSIIVCYTSWWQLPFGGDDSGSIFGSESFLCVGEGAGVSGFDGVFWGENVTTF